MVVRLEEWEKGIQGRETGKVRWREMAKLVPGLAMEVGMVQKDWVQRKAGENWVLAMVVALEEEMKERRMGRTKDLVHVIKMKPLLHSIFG